MTVLHVDFETRGSADLKKVGLDNYARHPDTDAQCMGYVFGDAVEVEMWLPSEELPYPVIDHVQSGGIVAGHNVNFEIAIWNHVLVPRYGFPELDPNQCRCTMAMAYAMAVPGSLERAAAAMGIREQKDVSGSRVMMQLATPRDIAPDGSPIWWDDAAKFQILYDYCKQDVRVERELDKRLMQLSAAEQKIWQLDHIINQRGIPLDQRGIQAAMAIVAAEQDKLNGEMNTLTQGHVGFCTEVKRLGDWIRLQGVAIEALAKADVLDALEDQTLPPNVRRALELRQLAAKTSTAKLQAMLDGASAEDGRIRGTMQYHGAGTGRWAGRRVQPHNMPRPKLEPERVNAAINAMTRLPIRDARGWLRIQYGSPLDAISSALRGMIKASEGMTFLAADFANIEGRALAWLAGEEKSLKAFRDFDEGSGPDIYCVAYAQAFGIKPKEVTKDQRQVGKVIVLSMGYGGGVGAFQTMAKGYGVKVADEEADSIKARWRDANPKIVQFWYALENAAKDALTQPGTVVEAGVWPSFNEKDVSNYWYGLHVKVSFKKQGSFLWCKLPSGRVLCYPYPKILPVETPWGEMKDAVTYMTVIDQTTRGKKKIIPDSHAKGDWQRVSTYGGKLAENVTQAICRDLLAEALLRAEKNNFPVVMHVHDEIVAEIPQNRNVSRLRAFEEICSEVPEWANGLLIVASGWEGERYRK